MEESQAQLGPKAIQTRCWLRMRRPSCGVVSKDQSWVWLELNLRNCCPHTEQPVQCWAHAGASQESVRQILHAARAVAGCGTAVSIADVHVVEVAGHHKGITSQGAMHDAPSCGTLGTGNGGVQKAGPCLLVDRRVEATRCCTIFAGWQGQEHGGGRNGCRCCPVGLGEYCYRGAWLQRCNGAHSGSCCCLGCSSGNTVTVMDSWLGRLSALRL